MGDGPRTVGNFWLVLTQLFSLAKLLEVRFLCFQYPVVEVVDEVVYFCFWATSFLLLCLRPQLLDHLCFWLAAVLH